MCLMCADTYIAFRALIGSQKDHIPVLEELNHYSLSYGTIFMVKMLHFWPKVKHRSTLYDRPSLMFLWYLHHGPIIFIRGVIGGHSSFNHLFSERQSSSMFKTLRHSDGITVCNFIVSSFHLFVFFLHFHKLLES